MNVDMYRDELLNEDDPTQIESKFSVFECEIADLIAKKILDKDEVIISRRELEKLRIFITLLSLDLLITKLPIYNTPCVIVPIFYNTIYVLFI